MGVDFPRHQAWSPPPTADAHDASPDWVTTWYREASPGVAVVKKLANAREAQGTQMQAREAWRRLSASPGTPKEPNRGQQRPKEANGSPKSCSNGVHFPYKLAILEPSQPGSLATERTHGGRSTGCKLPPLSEGAAVELVSSGSCFAASVTCVLAEGDMPFCGFSSRI